MSGVGRGGHEDATCTRKLLPWNLSFTARTDPQQIIYSLRADQTAGRPTSGSHANYRTVWRWLVGSSGRANISQRLIGDQRWTASCTAVARTYPLSVPVYTSYRSYSIQLIAADLVQCDRIQQTLNSHQTDTAPTNRHTDTSCTHSCLLASSPTTTVQLLR